MKSKQCRICENATSNPSYIAREMMFGFRDRFEYFECSNCQCLQIAEIPEDLSKYYPPYYYSLIPSKIKKESKFKRYLKRQRTIHALGKPNFPGRIFTKFYGTYPYTDWCKTANISLKDAILDVGSGAGELLLTLYNAGFEHLTGIDPYIAHDYYYHDGVEILKCNLSDVNNTYDFIMLHHVFEHITDPLIMLKNIYRLLKFDRYALIRIPVSGSYVWRKYGPRWVQLDAPRHLFLHSEKSMGLLAKQVGFEVEQVIYDSTAFQFWGSEKYHRDIPLKDKCTDKKSPQDNIFTMQEMQTFKLEAQRLNAVRDGDQASFYLRKR